jgi:hypothetical protein
MPAQSQQQQKLFGLALAFKRGEVPASEVSDEIKDIADRMSEKEIEDFASTKHKGLPKMKEQLRKIVREIMREKVISEINEGKKRFRQQDGIGKAKYTISYHDGKQKHKDGSDFFGIQIFKNKKDLETFRNALLKKGYIEESIEEGIISEVERGDMGYVEKHKSIATVYDVMGKKLKVKLGKTGKVVTIDSKDIQILPESVNEESINEAKIYKVIFAGMQEKDAKDFFTMVDGSPKIKAMTRDSGVFKVGNEVTIRFGVGSKQELELIKKVAKLERLKIVKIDESVNEARVSIEAASVANLTGTRNLAVQDFIDAHNLNARKLYKHIKSGSLKDRMEFVTALAGKPNNTVQKKIIKMFNESINEGYSTEEKRIVMMAVRKLSKYRNVPIDQSINDLLGAGQELERDIKKGKITK